MECKSNGSLLIFMIFYNTKFWNIRPKILVDIVFNSIQYQLQIYIIIQEIVLEILILFNNIIIIIIKKFFFSHLWNKICYIFFRTNDWIKAKYEKSYLNFVISYLLTHLSKLTEARRRILGTVRLANWTDCPAKKMSVKTLFSSREKPDGKFNNFSIHTPSFFFTRWNTDNIFHVSISPHCLLFPL